MDEEGRPATLRQLGLSGPVRPYRLLEICWRRARFRHRNLASGHAASFGILAPRSAARGLQVSCPELHSVRDRAWQGNDVTKGGTETLRLDAQEPLDGGQLSIGPYRIVGLLGEGGMGRVYLAQQVHPQRQVALKVVRGVSAAVI